MKLIKLISSTFSKAFVISTVLGMFFSLTITYLSVDSTQQVLVFKITGVTFAFFVIIYAIQIYFNKKTLTKKIDLAFKETTVKLNAYNVKSKKTLHFPKVNISELTTLNASIADMAGKIEKDYRLLKEYTENVSHEIQTPLAIIKNKIELLLQDPTLSKEHLLTLAKLHQSTGRLSKLSKNLAVLTKIENNQFIENSEVNLSDFITERLEDFEELIELKNIHLETNFEETPKLSMNSTLCYLLFNNLISNAVRHNIKNGKIDITITKNKFIITNTGNPLKTSKFELFNRFTKSSESFESTGLGLSMVKKIISFYGFFIAYKNVGGLHTITVIFVEKFNH